jgi:hypothetical protein
MLEMRMRPGSRRAGWFFLILAVICGAVTVPPISLRAASAEICRSARRTPGGQERVARQAAEERQVEIRLSDRAPAILHAPARMRVWPLSQPAPDILYQRPPPFLSHD